jgi:O-antigen/teichoic acid export membrane protein
VGSLPIVISTAVSALKRATYSRVFWFFMERATSTGFGFLLSAILTRFVPLHELAEYLTALAAASIFEPLLGASVSAYLARMLRACESEADRQVVMKSAFLLLQAAAAMLALALTLGELAGADHLFTALVFLQVAFAPWKLFSMMLLAQDRYLESLPVQVLANILGGALRIAVFALTHNLTFVALLLCFEPVIAGVALARLAKVNFLKRPVFSQTIALDLLKALPSLTGAMLLICAYYRSPVILARWYLSPLDVVHIAIVMQMLTGFGIIQSSLAQSLIGPLTLNSRNEAAFLSYLQIGSATVFLYGVLVLLVVVLFGGPILTLVYGTRAMGSWQIAMILAPICTFGGIHQLMLSLINLRGRPSALFYLWAVVSVSQGATAVILHYWHSPLVIAAGTSASYLVGLGTVPLFQKRIRAPAFEAIAGFRRLSYSRQLWGQMRTVMLFGPA